MSHKVHYATVSEAIEILRKQGYIIDFNLNADCIIAENTKLKADDFEIKDAYRYEGDTDPADEATVYAIESTSGLKGILVTGYGIYSDTISTEILKKLHY